MTVLTLRAYISNALTRSIRTRIWLAVSLCIFAVGLVATSNYFIMRDTAALPRQLYEKPYRVGLAVRDLRADFAVMHAELSDLAESPSRLGLRRFDRRMQEIDQRSEVLKSTIANRFVGDPKLVDAAFAALQQWNTVRTQVVQAIRANDQVQAYTLAKTEGYNQVKELEASLTRLIESANEHSHRLYEDANTFLALARTQGMFAAAVALLFLGSAAILINTIVVRPVREIGEAMQGIADGNLKMAIPHDDRIDEIGMIAKSSRVFLKHAINIQESSIDLLTSLPKRHQMIGHIAIDQLDPASRKDPCCLLHVDLDGFVEVNDILGRDVGDKLLVHVANQLRSIRGGRDFIAREGADSFVWYRKGISGPDDAIALASQIQTVLDTPMIHDDQEVRSDCSIGIAIDRKNIPAEKLLIHAENALMETKRQSSRSYSIYTDEMDARLLRRRETLRGLRFALAHNEIVPFFQPQVDIRTGELRGFECLARWAHPEHGVVTPWQFLPVAKGAGLLGSITDTMISQSLRQLASWRKNGLDVPRISLNLDASDLERDGFADRLMLEMDKHGLVPNDICLELLESAMIEDGENPVSKTLNRLGQMGFPIELDDFGTGHAAIASLRLIALNGIKIDRSFVTKLHERPSQMKLTRAMLRLAHAMQIKTVAEGVESPNERDLLLELGCDVIQGFGIGKPMSGDDATLWLEAFTPDVGRMDASRRVA